MQTFTFTYENSETGAKRSVSVTEEDIEEQNDNWHHACDFVEMCAYRMSNKSLTKITTTDIK